MPIRPARPALARSFALALALAGLASVAGAATRDHEAETTRLLTRAEERLARRTIEARREAIEDLERANGLSPRRLDVLLALARAYEQAGFRKQSRLRYERAIALVPDDPEARFGLAQAWRRDWLKYVDRRSLDRAVEHLSACVRLDPSRSDAWMLLSSLQVERGELRTALAAAERSLAADPGRPEPLLAVASARWRLGEVAGADSLFRLALGRLRSSVRERFEDFAPLASERDTAEYRRLSPAGREEFERRFWREHDPDPTSPENEAQLEYWARVAQAYFLFFDPRRRTWDERGEVYVRYGAPDSVQYNPVGMLLYGHGGAGDKDLRFPLNVLVWSYERLGMTVVMNDRLLSERYELPVSTDQDMDPQPDPDSLRGLDVVATRGSRGVFPARPPGQAPLEVGSQLARFESGDGGSHLFAAISAPGGPADSLRATFVVLDSAFREVRRERRSLAPSACDPSALRIADFDAALPPGRYLVGLSAERGARRGATRTTLEVPPPDGSLLMSDLVLTCGLPPAPTTSVRLDANPAGRVGPGQPLVAYFEVYHLARDAQGEGRFEYETAVRSAHRDRRIWIQRWLSPRREGQDLGFTRQDRVLGTVRRQYVSVPVQGLPPGRYRLDLTVRDVLSGEERRTSAEFVRD